MSGSTKALLAAGVFCFAAYADKTGKFDVPVLGDGGSESSQPSSQDDNCYHSKYINYCNGPESGSNESAEQPAPEQSAAESPATTAAKKVAELACFGFRRLEPNEAITTARQAALVSTVLFNRSGQRIEWNQVGAPGISSMLNQVEGNAQAGFITPDHCTAEMNGGSVIDSTS